MQNIHSIFLALSWKFLFQLVLDLRAVPISTLTLQGSVYIVYMEMSFVNQEEGIQQVQLKKGK